MLTQQIMKKVAVVGAGAAGLCCARHLSRYPEHFTFSVFEQGSEVGGTWIYEKNGRPLQDVRHSTGQEGAPPVHSSMYKNLRYKWINASKRLVLIPERKERERKKEKKGVGGGAVGEKNK